MAEEDVPLDRGEVERILRRASEFAGHGGDDGTGISERALVAAAEEAGLPAEAVRHSIAIERLGQMPEPQAGDRLAGPHVVSVDVDLDMPVGEALERLDAWLVVGHHLRRDRFHAAGGEWSHRDGLVAGGVRAVRSTMGEGKLGEVRRVTAVARAHGRGTVLRLSADRSRSRLGWLGSGTGVGVAGTAGAVLGAVLVSPLIAIAAPAAVGAGLAVASAGRSQAARLEAELRRVLESVAGGTRPTTLRQDLTRWAVRGTTRRQPAGRAPRP
jgi:hypothetical protein